MHAMRVRDGSLSLAGKGGEDVSATAVNTLPSQSGIDRILAEAANGVVLEVGC